MYKNHVTIQVLDEVLDPKKEVPAVVRFSRAPSPGATAELKERKFRFDPAERCWRGAFPFRKHLDVVVETLTRWGYDVEVIEPKAEAEPEPAPAPTAEHAAVESPAAEAPVTETPAATTPATEPEVPADAKTTGWAVEVETPTAKKVMVTLHRLRGGDAVPPEWLRTYLRRRGYRFAQHTWFREVADARREALAVASTLRGHVAAVDVYLDSTTHIAIEPDGTLAAWSAPWPAA